MVYNNYEIQPVSAEDSFLYETKDELYWLGSTHGFVLGGFTSLEDTISQNGDVIAQLRGLYKSVESLLDEYTKLHKKVSKEWIRRGKPYSIKAQTILKEKCDRGNRIKAEYYDR